ncbi:MAG: molybdopterin-guanine dinucleotide biosynthesis protein B [Planctomycetota bacterium]|nr:molybdopterin-guanine dinucleotide biosynthesis protein B [Planctomycetota bacterium]
MKRIHIIGRKNSGKTTLIVELVQHLSSRGYRVATVKHTHHQHELDTPGKDSYRHRLAGAAAVGILSPSLSAVFWPPAASEDGAARYDRLLANFPDCDLVLVEGDSQANAIRIEVWRKAESETPMVLDDKTITGVVTDDDVQVPVPVWSRSDVATLAAKLFELLGS